MADKTLSEVVGSGGGGGDFAVRTIASNVRSAGSTTIVSVVPPTGQKVKLTYLEVSSADTTEANVNVSFGSTDVFFGSIGPGITPTNAAEEAALTVGYIPTGTIGRSPRNAHRHLMGKTDEALLIAKSSGTTSHEISYGYETGE